MPCGYSLARSVEEGQALLNRPELGDTEVWALAGDAYFSRPGPRIVDGLEILAWAVHPEAYPEPAPGAIAHLG